MGYGVAKVVLRQECIVLFCALEVPLEKAQHCESACMGSRVGVRLVLTGHKNLLLGQCGVDLRRCPRMVFDCTARLLTIGVHDGVRLFRRWSSVLSAISHQRPPNAIARVRVVLVDAVN